MIKRSTFSDLITYAYNETGLHDSDSIQRNLDADPVLQAEYNEINNILAVLDTVKPEVSEESIKKILQFC